MTYDNRKYLIFDISELSLINFEQVLETSIDSIRKSVDQTKTFVKWDGEEDPGFVNDLTTKSGPYTHEQILQILSTPEWSSNLLP